MNSRKNDGIPLKKLVMIPLLLLAGVVVLTFFGNKNVDYKAGDFNPYFTFMPNKYGSALSLVEKKDSTFFQTVIENNGIRELLIFRKDPAKEELSTDFDLKIYPTDKTLGTGQKPFIQYSVERNATSYNYNMGEYSVLAVPLPNIDLDSLVIKQKQVQRKKKAWSTSVNKPFKKIKSRLSPEAKIAAPDSEVIKPNPYRIIYEQALKQNGIYSVNSTYAERNDSLYLEIENFSAINADRNLASVNHWSDVFDFIARKDTKSSKMLDFKGPDAESANSLIRNYLDKNSNLNEVFDIKKLADYLALRTIFTNGCDESASFMFNPESSLIEPIFDRSECLGMLFKRYRSPGIEDQEFKYEFLSSLNDLANADLYSEYIAPIKTLESELALINSYYPELILDTDILYINQRVISKAMDVSDQLMTEVISFDKLRVQLGVHNTSQFPVDIQGINYKPRKEIARINPRMTIAPKKKDTIIIDLPRSFENLFVSKKNKESKFILHKHIYDLNLSYSITGTKDVFYGDILSYKQDEADTDDLFRSGTKIKENTDFKVDEGNKTIQPKNKSMQIDYPLVLPKNYTFVLKPGDSIDIVSGGKIISYATIEFKGNIKNPVIINSSDGNGQGMIVISSEKESVLENVIFKDLSNPKHGQWNVTGAVTFYESPVALKLVEIKGNACEDALNIIRTTFRMEKCRLSDTQSDAFDGDFVKGTISDSKFYNLGNDAIDVSGSDIAIENVLIENAGDKGLSAGEDSRMEVKKVHIRGSEIAVAGKDLSEVTIKDLKIENTKLGFTAFKKKPEFGPSSITVSQVTWNEVETKYLIESSSSLHVDGTKIKTTNNVKDRMYGVEFGVSSEETRNKQ